MNAVVDYIRCADEPFRLRRERTLRKYNPPKNIKDKVLGLAKCKDNVHGLMAMLEDFAVIVLAIGLTLWSVYLYPVTCLLIGTRHRALASLLHEASHFNLARHRGLNMVMGMISGWSVFQTFYAYRKSHVTGHHSHLGDAEKDPDYVNYINQGLFAENADTFLRRNMVSLVFGLKAWANVKNLVRDRLLPQEWKSMQKKPKLEYLGFTAFWATILLVLVWTETLLYFVMFWLVPYLTIFQATNWLIELAEHFPLIRHFDTEVEITRNRFGHSIDLFFTGVHNENYHLVHHLFSTVPFYKMSQAHAILMEDPIYAAANGVSGGLLTKGDKGEQSIVSMIGEQLSMTQASAQ